jgi:hypothetical protein
MKWFKREPGEGVGVLLRAWDRFVVPVARRAETLKSRPFGQSLVAVGRTSNRTLVKTSATEAWTG